MDVDVAYPELSSLAQREGFTLKRLANEATPHDSHLRLSDCCMMAETGSPRWSHADVYNYLTTLNEFVKRLSPDHKTLKTLWRRLTSKRLANNSTLLDAISETAWAIYFLDNGYSIELDKQFDATDPNSKNADIVVNLNGKRIWFDVISIESKHAKTSSRGLTAGVSIESVYSRLEQVAIKKYNSKFKKAVLTGKLVGDSAGILLCYIKSEVDIIPPILPRSGNIDTTTPPTNLFSVATAGLDYVYVNSLFPYQDGNCLFPNILFKWSRFSANEYSDI